MMGLIWGHQAPQNLPKWLAGWPCPMRPSARLANISDQLAALRDRQNEIGALQQKLDSDRKAIATLAAEVQQRSDALDDRDAALRTRVAKFEATVAAFEQKLAPHEATLESDIMSASPKRWQWSPWCERTEIRERLQELIATKLRKRIPRSPISRCRKSLGRETGGGRSFACFVAAQTDELVARNSPQPPGGG